MKNKDIKKLQDFAMEFSDKMVPVVAHAEEAEGFEKTGYELSCLLYMFEDALAIIKEHRLNKELKEKYGINDMKKLLAHIKENYE